jgi:hypothetical protein
MFSSFLKKYIMLDPNFPSRLLRFGKYDIAQFIQLLYIEYSRRSLTNETDRCAAISGLESRIAQAMKCETRFGIFQSYLHRSLLWQRSEEQNTTRIGYENQIVPSWSWMAYNGSIQFMNISFGWVEWVHSLKFNKRPINRWFNKKWKPALVTDIGSFRRCSLQQRDTGCALLDSGGDEKGWIQYDVGLHEHLDAEKCVVVGRYCRESDAGERKYYILVVRSTGLKNEYTRVGVGWILSGYVTRQGVQALIV